MGSISVPRVGPGRPRTRPDHLVADKGYSSRKIHAYLRRRGIPHTIPERVDQILGRLNRGIRGGRPPGFDRDIYRHRCAPPPHPGRRLRPITYRDTMKDFQSLIGGGQVRLRSGVWPR